MRLWLKDSERRQDPAPVKTDDRKAFAIGMVLWLIGLGALFLFVPGPDHAWWIWACVAGLVIGVIGLGWTIWRRRAKEN